MDDTSDNRARPERTLTIVVMLAAASAASALIGCQTTKGAGEDIEDLGETIQDAADDATD